MKGYNTLYGRNSRDQPHHIFHEVLCYRSASLLILHNHQKNCFKYFFGGLQCVGYAFADKKEKKTFLIYKEIQMGSGAKSNIRKGFLIYEEMRKFFPIYEEAVIHI
jgi:hypothetical protein